MAYNILKVIFSNMEVLRKLHISVIFLFFLFILFSFGNLYSMDWPGSSGRIAKNFGWNES